MIRVDHRFPAMGGTARITLESETVAEPVLERHAAAIRALIEDVEAALSRFRPDSELSTLNRDPRPAVPASPLLRRFALAVRSAGARSGGLVDATLLAPLERQGYTTSRAGVVPAVPDEALDHGWWLAGRSAGIVAYLLLSASVVAGPATALRLAAPRHAALLRTVHERIALVAFGALAAHGLLLLGDGFLRPGPTGILVPFAMSYRPAWTGIGVLAGYLTAGLSLTYYTRGRIGARRWRAAHRLIPIAWAMAVVHVIGPGSDAGSLWLQVPLAVTMAAVLTLLGYRLLGGRAAAAPVPNRRAPAPPPRPFEAPAEPMPVVPVAADEPVTTVAPPTGYRPLWARNGAPPSG